MPIYEYECEGCHTVFEVTQRISDAPLQEHACGSKKVKRLISPTAFHLKGEGWYVTDYAGKKSEKSSAASAVAPSSTEKGEKTTAAAPVVADKGT